jgi:valyl-tRNA synthetase
VNANEEEEATKTDDRSMQNVEDWGHSRFDMWTSDVNGYECKDGDNADMDEDEEASQADDESTQNVEDWGHN